MDATLAELAALLPSAPTGSPGELQAGKKHGTAKDTNNNATSTGTGTSSTKELWDAVQGCNLNGVIAALAAGGGAMSLRSFVNWPDVTPLHVIARGRVPQQCAKATTLAGGGAGGGAGAASEEEPAATSLGAAAIGADANTTTALGASKEEQCAAIVTALVVAGADVDAVDGGGHLATPLHWAAHSGNAAAAEALLDGGANVDARDLSESTPLHWAASKASTEVVWLLLKAGANVNARDESNKTPLHWGSLHSSLLPEKRYRQTMQLLLASGADADAKACDAKLTPLMWAAAGCCLVAVQELLAAGANVHERDLNGFTALHWAVRACAGHPHHLEQALLVRHLVGAGADPDARAVVGPAGRAHNPAAPLVFAARECQPEVVAAMVASGATVTEAIVQHVELTGVGPVAAANARALKAQLRADAAWRTRCPLLLVRYLRH